MPKFYSILKEFWDLAQLPTDLRTYWTGGCIGGGEKLTLFSEGVACYADN